MSVARVTEISATSLAELRGRHPPGARSRHQDVARRDRRLDQGSAGQDRRRPDRRIPGEHADHLRARRFVARGGAGRVEPLRPRRRSWRAATVSTVVATCSAWARISGTAMISQSAPRVIGPTAKRLADGWPSRVDDGTVGWCSRRRGASGAGPDDAVAQELADQRVLDARVVGGSPVQSMTRCASSSRGSPPCPRPPAHPQPGRLGLDRGDPAGVAGPARRRARRVARVAATVGAMRWRWTSHQGRTWRTKRALSAGRQLGPERLHVRAERRR